MRTHFFPGKRTDVAPLQFWKTRVRVALLYCMYLWSGKNGRGKNCPFFFFFFRLTLKPVKQYQASGGMGFDVGCRFWDRKTCHYSGLVFLVHFRTILRFVPVIKNRIRLQNVLPAAAREGEKEEEPSAAASKRSTTRPRRPQRPQQKPRRRRRRPRWYLYAPCKRPPNQNKVRSEKLDYLFR